MSSSISSYFSAFFDNTIHNDAPEDKPEEKSSQETNNKEEEAEEPEAAEEEEEEEPEDEMPAIREACEKTAACAPAVHHFQHCQEKVNAGEGFKGEDCVEELCIAPRLFTKLK
ncbi:hypothetical protein BDV98DRAFT_566718 [Pterulicium gracile]|uniref:Ubiquinol-cytochrome C reductase hinge domain-containing protein n=1 Tax=Pterulicium gracile TaxID=1884261 RepID=A0A5C3QP87_9AGAR|nr:hypothetical protein BDV98DRAFT_566718 [Pterula gracilis]